MLHNKEPRHYDGYVLNVVDRIFYRNNKLLPLYNFIINIHD
jgi:hypothetical protein